MKRSPLAFTWRNGWLPGRKISPPWYEPSNSVSSNMMPRFQIMQAPPASSSAPAHSAMRMPSPSSVTLSRSTHQLELPGHRSCSISSFAP